MVRAIIKLVQLIIASKSELDNCFLMQAGIEHGSLWNSIFFNNSHASVIVQSPASTNSTLAAGVPYCLIRTKSGTKLSTLKASLARLTKSRPLVQ